MSWLPGAVDSLVTALTPTDNAQVPTLTGWAGMSAANFADGPNSAPLAATTSATGPCPH